MTELRYFVCESCETVFEDIEIPPHCRHCGDGPIEKVAPKIQAMHYFAG